MSWAVAVVCHFCEYQHGVKGGDGTQTYKSSAGSIGIMPW